MRQYAEPARRDQFTINRPRELEDFLGDLLDTVSEHDTDEEVARWVADWYWLQRFGWGQDRRSRHIHLSIIYASGPQWRRTPIPIGMDWDWKYQNVIGISTTDYARAREWTIRAMCEGFSVCYGHRQKGSAGGRGSIDFIRDKARQSMGRSR